MKRSRENIFKLFNELSENEYKRIFFGILTITLGFVLIMSLFFFIRHSRKTDTIPRAVNGILDLSNVDISKHQTIYLDGEWAFYWKQLLTPDDFKDQQSVIASTHYSVPGPWIDSNVSAEDKGYATYRLRILNKTHQDHMALELSEIRSSYKLWIDEVLVAEGGSVGEDVDKEIPYSSVKLVPLTLGEKPVELILQVSNHQYGEGGVLSPIKLGQLNKLIANQHFKLGLASLCIGSMLLISCSHLVLFYFRRKNTAELYFTFFCFIWIVFILTWSQSNWVGIIAGNFMPSFIIDRVNFICEVIFVPVGYMFFQRLYPYEFSQPINRVMSILALLFITLSCLLPPQLFANLFWFFAIFILFFIFYTNDRLLVAALKKREGAFCLFIGFYALGIALLNDILNDIQVIETVFLLPLGLLIFIFSKSISLSFQTSHAFVEIERISEELKEQNFELEKVKKQRLKVQSDIVNICEEARSRIGQDLHDGLCQILIGLRLHFSLLKAKLEVEYQEFKLDTCSDLLEEAVNSAYSLSHSLISVKHGSSKTFLPLQEFIRRVKKTTGINIKFDQKCGCPSCPNKALSQLYKIAQEAINNAIKHANPNNIDVVLNCEDRKNIFLSITNDGIGEVVNNTTSGGLGRGIMNNRAKIMNGNLVVTELNDGKVTVECQALCDIYAKSS